MAIIANMNFTLKFLTASESVLEFRHSEFSRASNTEPQLPRQKICRKYLPVLLAILIALITVFYLLELEKGSFVLGADIFNILAGVLNMFNLYTSVILCIALFNLNWALKKYTKPDNINTWLFRAFFALVVLNTVGFIGLIISQHRLHQITEVTS